MSIKSLFLTLICGLFFLGFGIFFTGRNKNYVETTAVITEIRTNRAGSDEDHDVFVAYTVDGQEYNALSDTYSSSYFEGKEIKIYYNPDDPSVIRGDSKVIGIILTVIGGVLTGITVFVAGAVILAAKKAGNSF